MRFLQILVVGALVETTSTMATLKCSGAQIVKHPADTFYGVNAGYFRNLNGHVWEVVWNPDLIPTDS